jgi:glycosyltransferase involved in cell wall biosynthesis
MPPGISVVIPVRNGEATLGRCLNGIFATRLPGLEVVVVDDASTDGTVRVAERFSCRVARHETARGAGAARNTGARAATSALVAFVDSDILVRPDTLARAADRLERAGADGVVGLLSKETEHGNFSSQYENLYMHYAYATHAEEMDILYTSFALVRRDAFLASGGFDERYRGSGIEDMELGQRMVGQGRRLVLDHDLPVFHLKRFSLATLLRANFRKASGTLRIMLRNLGSGARTRKHVAPPWSFVAGIPLTFVALALAGAGLALGSAPLAWAGAAGLAGTVALNLPFLNFLRRERGVGFLFPAVGFMILNYVNYGFGLGHGLLGFVRGARY